MRGGKRKGAGRPTGSFAKVKRKKDTISIFHDEWAELDKIGPSRGRAVQKLIAYWKIMDKELPKIERYLAEFPGETSCVYIYFGDITVRVEVPVGHSADDINVDISTGNGWING